MGAEQVITFGIFVLVCLILWSKARKQTLGETVEKIKEQVADTTEQQV